MDKPTPAGRYQRSIFGVKFAQTGEREIEFSCSSANPVDVGGWIEILDHSPQAVDMERLSAGVLNLLFNHERNDYLGVIVNGRLENGRMVVRAKFDTHSRAEQMLQSVLNGVISAVSIGYRIIDWVERGGQVFVTKWEPLEVSLVTVPADASVGIGRQDKSPHPGRPAEVKQTNKSGAISMSTQNVQPSLEEHMIAERERVQALALLAQRDGVDRHTLNKWMTQNFSLEQALAETYAARQAREAPPRPIGTIALGMSNQESRQYSLIKAIRSLASKNMDEAGLEWEASRAIAAKLGRPADKFYIPVADLTIPTRAIAQRSGTVYQTGRPEAAGVLVELEVMPVTEAYRALTQVMALGSTMLTGLQGNLSFPTHDSTANAGWVAEGQPLPDVNSELGNFTMSPRTTGAISSVTNQMLAQSSQDLETWVRLDLATAVAEAIDQAAINGSGIGATPRGILQTSGVNVVSIGPNGGPLTWANVVDFEREVAQANAIRPTSRLGYLTSPKVAAHMKVTEREIGTGNYLWESAAIISQGQRPGFGQVNSYPAAVSTHIPDNLVKGSGTGLSGVIFGDWSQLLIGEWGALQLDVNPYGRGWQSGSVEIRVMTLIDIALRRPAAFSVATDVDAD